MKDKTCCFTGHRTLQKEQLPEIIRQLEAVIEKLIQQGVIYYGCGGAIGFDQLAGEAVLSLKKKHPQIKLIMVLPCAEQDKNWPQTAKYRYRALLAACDKIVYIQQAYDSGCMHRRNRHLVDNSGVCVAWFAGRLGGTEHTINYAKQQGITVINIAGRPFSPNPLTNPPGSITIYTITNIDGGTAMTPFLNENFLLTTETAREMFAAAKQEPIFDWHCHLSPKEIHENETSRDIAQLWLDADHYKWRAMRSCGVPERLITGDAPGKEKFMAWAACMPKLIGNPLHHWAHLELQRFFDCYDVLDANSAQKIWDHCNAKIQNGGFTPRELITKSNVAALCTTDDPADSLEYHQVLAKENLPFKVLPAFRPDKALGIEQAGFLPWLAQMEQTAGRPLRSFNDLREALLERADFFHALGCCASDHGFKYVPYAPAEESEIERIFSARLQGELPGELEADQYQTALLQALAAKYADLGWAMELHLGPMRGNNARMLGSIGPDTGFDSIGDWPVAWPLSRFLDSMDEQNLLPKTILFNLNPRDNHALGTMAGNFQGSEAAGKVQFGPAWWFLDNIDGMREQLKALGNLGALGTFVGMVTDSRSFLSYPRHEYFRRIFCGLAGEWVEQGLFPYDKEALAGLARDVSFRNAERYFGL